MHAPRHLDRVRCERLAEEILRPIRVHYLTEPISSERVWEVLDALSFAVAGVIKGVGERPQRRAAQTFFNNALIQHLAHLLRAPTTDRAH